MVLPISVTVIYPITHTKNKGTFVDAGIAYF